MKRSMNKGSLMHVYYYLLQNNSKLHFKLTQLLPLKKLKGWKKAKLSFLCLLQFNLGGQNGIITEARELLGKESVFCLLKLCFTLPKSSYVTRCTEANNYGKKVRCCEFYENFTDSPKRTFLRLYTDHLGRPLKFSFNVKGEKI